jgi:hypothetical protein
VKWLSTGWTIWFISWHGLRFCLLHQILKGPGIYPYVPGTPSRRQSSWRMNLTIGPLAYAWRLFLALFICPHCVFLKCRRRFSYFVVNRICVLLRISSHFSWGFFTYLLPRQNSPPPPPPTPGLLRTFSSTSLKIFMLQRASLVWTSDCHNSHVSLSNKIAKRLFYVAHISLRKHYSTKMTLLRIKILNLWRNICDQKRELL